jgi:SAM-dependent methyltransferase
MAEAAARIYRDAEHYDRIAALTAPADLRFYERLVSQHPGPVLELGCGTGRVSLPLAAGGADVVGIDRSPELLAHARVKADLAGISVDFREEDFCAFELGRRFALVLFPYNALNHLFDIDALLGCFACVSRHLRPDGRFVIDTFNPDPAALAVNPAREQRVVDYVDTAHGGRRVTMFETNAYDAALQINRVTWLYRNDAGELIDRDELDMRVYFPRELDALLQLTGFEVVRKLGGYDGRPFEARRSKQLLICRRHQG